MAEKVIDLEMNQDGVMEEKKGLLKKGLEWANDHKVEIAKGIVKFTVTFGAGALVGYYVVPAVVDSWTGSKTVAQVAEEFANAVQ